jgi:hypothetical protein
MKEFLFQQLKSFKKQVALFKTRCKRMTVSTVLSSNQFYEVSIIINNRNRFTFLKQLITWLENNGYKNIYIIDNQSTYQPLLEYYKTISYKIFFLDENVGYMSLWQTPIFNQFKNSYYVYTDSDVLPTENCPKNIIEELYKVLKKYKNIEKAGVALKIDDIPNNYKNKAEVIRIESEWWKKEIEKDLFDAPVDTTFALYRPLAKGNAEECKAYRVAGKLSFFHQPWYENSASPSEEDVFYKNSVSKNSSYWLNFK